MQENTNGSWKHGVKGKKTDTKKYISYDSRYMAIGQGKTNQ